jgi:predicted acyl esterase
LPETEDWRTTDTWPITEAVHHPYALRADGSLSEDEGEAGSTTYINLGGGLNRPLPSETNPPSFLDWTSPPLTNGLDLIGPIELRLDTACTAPDTAFIAVLQDVDENGTVINVTSGYLRAGLRGADDTESDDGAPVLPCRVFEAVLVGQKVSYRVPLVPNARRFRAGHKLRLYLTSDSMVPQHQPTQSGAQR